MSAEGAPIRRCAMAWGYGMACHLLFVVGVASMIVVMFGGMTTGLGRVPWPWNLASNTLLLLQFPLLHSWLLTRTGSRFMARLAPRDVGLRLVTTIYGALASVQVGLLFLCWSPSGIVWWTARGLPLAALISLYGASWLLLAKAILDAGFAYQVGLLGWRAVAGDRPVRYPPMPTRGLFRLCRQPIYVAFALTLWTVPVWTPDQLAVAGVLTLYCALGPLLKEARFVQRFGAEFRAYQAIVPYWLPWPRPGGRR